MPTVSSASSGRIGYLQPVNLYVQFNGGRIRPLTSLVMNSSVLSLYTDVQTNQSTITDHTRVFIDVISPPLYGNITLDGAPTSHFTLQQAYDGRVVYHNTVYDLSVYEHFRMWARYSEGPTPTPFAFPFMQGVPSTAPGDQQLGMYYGLMLVGATGPDLWQGDFDTYPAIDNSFTVTTANANSVLVVGVTAFSSAAGSTPPPAPSVTAIDFAGLTFHQLSRQTAYVVMPNPSTGVRNYMMEVWWALAPTPVSATMTISGIGFDVGHFLLGNVSVFRNLANPASPFDTNASNFQHFTTNAPPWTGMVMTPDAPEIQVLPWVYELFAGNDESIVGLNPGFAPRGFGVTTWVYDGAVAWRTEGRGPFFTECYVSFYIPPELIDSELFFDPVTEFVDFNNSANRAKFVSDDGTPQWVGGHGELPFRAPAAVYLNTMGPPIDFTTNNGTAGAFPVSGTIDPASTNPGCSFPVVDEIANAAPRDGWRLSVSDDGAQTWNRLVKPRSIGAEGDYLRRLRWLKMGQSRERVLKLECTDPVRRNIIGVYIDGSEGMG